MSKIIDTGNRVVGPGKYMAAVVELDDSKVDIGLHAFTHVRLAGFTGGMTASLSDADGKLLYITPLVQLGVDGALIFFSQSDRRIDTRFDIDPAVAAKVDRIDVWLGIAPKSRLDDWLGWAVRLLGEKRPPTASEALAKLAEMIRSGGVVATVRNLAHGH